MTLLETYTVEKYIDGAATFSIHYYHDDPSLAILTSLKVDPKKRGKGLGNLALKKAEHLCLTKGFNRIALQTKKDSWMWGWYQRHGYEKTGEGAWLMKIIFC